MYLSVAASGKELRLVRVVYNGLELSGCKQAVVSHESVQAPHDAGAVVGGTDALCVACVQFHTVHDALVLLHRRDHFL